MTSSNWPRVSTRRCSLYDSPRFVTMLNRAAHEGIDPDHFQKQIAQNAHSRRARCSDCVPYERVLAGIARSR